MHDADYYKKLGFKCGLEIHQRLATRHKLFCKCSASMQEDVVIGTIKRRQRAVAGETGTVDRSTVFESSKGREFVYNIYDHSSCLIDLDEEPPMSVNKDAVESALRLSSAFNCRFPDEIEPMRKGVVDGSDPSAFQRSMIVAHNGYVESGGNRFKISSVFLEEESSGIESQNPESVIYNTDRLGVPLIEIDTAPDIHTPKDAKEVALKIGVLLRLTGKRIGDFVKSEVQRGIGTIRQDVNVSITGGTRVEIKGVQQLEEMDKVIENEVERQVRLLELKKELIARSAMVGKPKDVTAQLKSTGAKMIKDSIKAKGVVIACGLRGFDGIIGADIGPNRRLGSEISDYAKMGGVKGIIHSDEDFTKYGFSEDEIIAVRKALEIGADDAFMMITAESDTAQKSMRFACDRAKMALSEVPPETRAILDPQKGTTRFMRPLPSGSRMYPETDAEPITIDEEYKQEIIDSTVYMDERTQKIKDSIGNEQLAAQMIMSPKLGLYEYIVANSKCERLVVATTILEKIKEIERSGKTINIADDVMLDIFNRYAKGEITKQGIVEVLKENPKTLRDVGSIIKKKSLYRITGDDLEEIVEGMKGKNKGEIMREVMSKYRLNVDGEELGRLVGA